jgi:putative transposase
MVDYLKAHYPVSERRACQVVAVARSVHRYQSIANRHEPLRGRLRELATTRYRYGYRRLHVLLRREGYQVGKHLVYRLYREEALVLRPRRPRRHVSAARRQRPVRGASHVNEAWSMDFVSDQLQNGNRFRALTVIDVHTRECLAIESGRRLTGDDVVRVLNRLGYTRGTPKRMYCDNGSEFTSHILDLWAYHNQVTMEFSRPGKPTDNGHIESFNGRLRDECLNAHWFRNLTDAKDKIETWRKDYNETRPHRALNYLTPNEFTAQHENWSQKTKR